MVPYDQLCDLGQALEQDERCARAEEQIAIEQQLRDDAAYRCPVEGCAAGDCPACMRIRELERELAALRGEAPLHVAGRYYAREADADTWRRIELEKRERYVERVMRVLARQRFDITPAGRDALRQFDGERERDETRDTARELVRGIAETMFPGLAT